MYFLNQMTEGSDKSKTGKFYMTGLYSAESQSPKATLRLWEYSRVKMVKQPRRWAM